MNSQENDECIQMTLEANWVVAARMLQEEDPFNLMVPNLRITRTTAPLQDGHDQLCHSNSVGNVDFEENFLVVSPHH